jgi:hypothetical protein
MVKMMAIMRGTGFMLASIYSSIIHHPQSGVVMPRPSGDHSGQYSVSLASDDAEREEDKDGEEDKEDEDGDESEDEGSIKDGCGDNDAMGNLGAASGAPYASSSCMAGKPLSERYQAPATIPVLPEIGSGIRALYPPRAVTSYTAK